MDSSLFLHWRMPPHPSSESTHTAPRPTTRTVMPRRNVKHVPGLHLDHAAIIHRGRRAHRKLPIPTCSTAQLFCSCRAPDVFRTIFILVRRSRARWSCPPTRTTLKSALLNVRSRRAAQIASGLPRAWVFPSSPLANSASTLDSVSRFTASF